MIKDFFKVSSASERDAILSSLLSLPGVEKERFGETIAAAPGCRQKLSKRNVRREMQK